MPADSWFTVLLLRCLAPGLLLASHNDQCCAAYPSFCATALTGALRGSLGRSDRPDGQFCQASLRTCCGVVLGRSLREKCPRAVATIQMGRAFGIRPRARDPIQSRSGSAPRRWESAKRHGQPVRRTCYPVLDIAAGQTRRAEELRRSPQSDGPKCRQFGFELARPPIPALRL